MIFFRRSTRYASAAALAALSCAAPAGAEVDFSREVQPILAQNCFHCHGPDEATRKGGLRLDVRENALQGGESGVAALLVEKPDESELLKRILSHDTDEVMPPPKEKKTLAPEQVDTLRRWIAEGARYSAHWAFVAPVRPEVPGNAELAQPEGKTPALNNSALPTNPIDALVARRLAGEGLKPAQPAPVETLVRRMYLDLVGLPPSPADVEAFVKADAAGRAKAVRDLVDTLLATPAFGEKWARHWLDLARYADSNGYEKDFAREQWAWRDWVIDAINRDLPYDQFIIQQVAGDLLPGAGQAGKIATGFLANSMINEEGAVVPELFRTDGMFDRMDALGKSVLGLTLQCAQCHTHKFDPITHDDYFGLYAFINQASDAQSWVYDGAGEKKIAEIQQGLAGVEARLKAEHLDWAARLAQWEQALRDREAARAWTHVVVQETSSASGLNHPVPQADHSILTLGHRTTRDDTFYISEPALEGATGLRIEALADPDLPFGGPGRSKLGTWALTELIVETQAPGAGNWEKVALANATADFSEPEGKVEPDWAAGKPEDEKRLRGPVAFLIDGKDDTGWRADRGPGRRNVDSVAVVQFAEPLARPAGTKFRVALHNHHGGDDNGGENMMLGRFRLSLTTAPAPQAEPVAYTAVRAMMTPPEKRTPEQQAAVFAAWIESDPALAAYAEQRAALWAQWPAPRTSVLHLAERSPDLPRETRLLDRGGWDQPKHKVEPHVPEWLHPLPGAADGAPRGREAFARWLADRRSPLTARVAVNRVWQTLFGTGLVETSEDFGIRAEPPAHPELLDWLSVEFMEKDWSLKRLLRLVMASGTYQQSSRMTPEERERDPSNRLLARGPRFRMEAEAVRDVALAAAGLLTEKVGGPSIYPPVPQNLLQYNYSVIGWPVAEGAERYRRALYVFRRRSMPDPVLSSFDAPNGDVSCARRVRSNTPLSALTGLNEPVFVEAARALALRTLREAGKDDAARADYAFRLCTSRAPKPAEVQAVLELLEDRRRQLAEGWLDPNAIATGQPGQRAGLPPGATPQDAAAWTLAARVLINLDETLTKN